MLILNKWKIIKALLHNGHLVRMVDTLSKDGKTLSKDGKYGKTHLVRMVRHT